MADEPSELHLLDELVIVEPAEPAEPHNLKSRPTRFGVEYVCTCGGWDGWANTPRMQELVRREHHDHWLQHVRR